MIVYKKETVGIRGAFKPELNHELITFAKNCNYSIPLNYHGAIFEKEMLRNDWRKMQLHYHWAPDERAWGLAKEALRHVFSPYMFASPWTYDEAVERMDKSASAGYPWNIKYSSKRVALEEEDALFRDIINQIQKTGKCKYTFNGKEYTYLYWSASPKGEMRVMEKLIHPDPTKRKCRTFMCSDIVTQIMMMMLFGEQNKRLLECNDVTWSKVGFSPFYGGFHQMATYLLQNFQKVMRKLFDCWDVSHMEASLNEMVLEALYELRKDHLLLDEDNLRMFDFIKRHVIYSMCIDVDGWLCMMIGKNPSGSFNTLSDNTLALILVLYYVVAKKSRDLKDLLSRISQHFCACVGDDSVVPHHEDFSNVAGDALDLGFVFKPERPTGELQDCSFTNCGFVQIQGRWFPKPNFDKVEANVFFHFKAKSWRLAYVKCCALRVLAWNFPEERLKAERLCAHIMKKYKRAMEVEHSVDDKISYDSAVSAYLPAEQIDFLWTGNESTPCTEVVFGILDFLYLQTLVQEITHHISEFLYYAFFLYQ